MRSAVIEQSQERPLSSAPVLNLHLIAGRWVNTNPAPAFIREIQLKPGGDGLTMEIAGADTGVPREWGETMAQPFAETPVTSDATALSALFRLDGLEVWVQGYIVKGVLVIVSFTRVTDGGDRSSHFGKEFFYRVS